MTRSSSFLLLTLLLERSIAHEFRLKSKALSRNKCFVRSALNNDESQFSSLAFHVRGGSDYYRGDIPEKKGRYVDPYGRDDQYSSDRYGGGDDPARSFRDDDRYGDNYDDRDYRDSEKVSPVSCSRSAEPSAHD